MFVVFPIPWATEALYPPGPNLWNSTSPIAQPIGDLVTPNTKPPAQVFNYLYRGWSLATKSAQQLALAGPLTNWCPEFKQTSTYTPLGISWDPTTLLWLLLQTVGPTTEVAASYGFDEGTVGTWVILSGAAFSTPNTPLYGSVSRGVLFGEYWALYTDNVGANNNLVGYYLPAAGSWTLQIGPAIATGQYYGCEITTLGAWMIWAVAGTAPVDSFLQWSTAPYSFGTQLHYGTAAAVGSTWLLKSNGGQVVAILSSDGLYNVYSTTPAALTANPSAPWTISTNLAGQLAAGKTVVALCWTQDAIGPCWLAAVQVTAGGNPPFFYRSADGNTWTSQAGGMSTNVTIVDMAAVGPLVWATLEDSALHGPSSSCFSVDGGVTWYPHGVVLTSNANPIGQNRTRVANSQTGLLMANGIWCRFSGVSGLPALPL